MEVRDIPVKEIAVVSRRRSLRDVGPLAESIGALGLLNPITVRARPNGDGYSLVTGNHRLEACKRLGWETIPAVLVPFDDPRWRIIEIDENLIRNELTALERAEHLRDRKAFYEKAHPDAVAGVRRAAGMNASQGHDVDDIVSPTFADDAAEKIGISPRSIQRDVAIAQKIEPTVKAKIRGTPLEDSKTDLIALTRLTPMQQHAAVKAVTEGKVESVKDYAKKAEPKKPKAIEIPRDPVGAAKALARYFSEDDLARIIAILLKKQDAA